MSEFVADLEALTLQNSSFRKVLYAAEHVQLVVMSLLPDEAIGEETHTEVDQFFRVERGRAKFVFDDGERLVFEGGGVVVPAGTRHNVVNASTVEPLLLYTIYSPPNHPDRTVHATRAAAEAAEEALAMTSTT
jgi:mannose-6-phosphate isomerase-like protein (cupin superfamily)